MDVHDLEISRARLLELKTELRLLIEESAGNDGPVELDQAKVGRLSRMDAIQAQQMALESTRRRQRQLLLVDSALRRVETGEYGFCLACDEEIDIRRLEVDPANTHCIQCAEKLGA
jgi:DnaK suppressor protein